MIALLDSFSDLLVIELVLQDEVAVPTTGYVLLKVSTEEQEADEEQG